MGYNSDVYIAMCTLQHNDRVIMQLDRSNHHLLLRHGGSIKTDVSSVGLYTVSQKMIKFLFFLGGHSVVVQLFMPLTGAKTNVVASG